MDVRAATAMAKVSRAIHGVEGLCGLLPLQTNFGRSIRETSQANSQIQYKNILKRTVVKAARSSDNQFGSGGRSRVDAEKTDLGVDVVRNKLLASTALDEVGEVVRYLCFRRL